MGGGARDTPRACVDGLGLGLDGGVDGLDGDAVDGMRWDGMGRVQVRGDSGLRLRNRRSCCCGAAAAVLPAAAAAAPSPLLSGLNSCTALATAFPSAASSNLPLVYRPRWRAQSLASCSPGTCSAPASPWRGTAAAAKSGIAFPRRMHPLHTSPSCLTSCPALPCPALPYPALPYPTLP